MPWPFDDDDNDNRNKRRDRFDSFDKEFEDMFRMMDGVFKDGGFGVFREGPFTQEPSTPTITDPRSHYLHDPRHANERKKFPAGKVGIHDTEVNIGDDYQALLKPGDEMPTVPGRMPGQQPRMPGQQPIVPRMPSFSGTSDTVSTSWSIRNGKTCKQECREQVSGRTRRVSVTSTDENGNVTTNEYTEEI